MRTIATIYTRRFPVTIRDERTGAEMQDYITPGQGPDSGGPACGSEL